MDRFLKELFVDRNTWLVAKGLMALTSKFSRASGTSGLFWNGVLSGALTAIKVSNNVRLHHLQNRWDGFAHWRLGEKHWWISEGGWCGFSTFSLNIQPRSTPPQVSRIVWKWFWKDSAEAWWWEQAAGCSCWTVRWYLKVAVAGFHNTFN
jgi:hypothetical protein